MAPDGALTPDSGSDESRIGEILEPHEPDPGGVLRAEALRGRESQPSLP